MELFEDDRFLIDLNDTQKGLYLMLLALAGKTNNKIRNDIGFIKSRLNLKNLKQNDIVKISQVFDKFKLTDNYWSFTNFEEVHNYTLRNSKGTPKELQRKSKGTPKDCPEVEVEREVEEEQEYIYKADFQKLWLKYPNRDGKKQAERHFRATVKAAQDAADIGTALENYKKHLELENWKKPKSGSTWFNNWRDWVDWKEPEKRETDEERDARIVAKLTK